MRNLPVQWSESNDRIVVDEEYQKIKTHLKAGRWFDGERKWLEAASGLFMLLAPNLLSHARTAYHPCTCNPSSFETSTTEAVLNFFFFYSLLIGIIYELLFLPYKEN